MRGREVVCQWVNGEPEASIKSRVGGLKVTGLNAAVGSYR